jgi:hypothetical protein
VSDGLTERRTGHLSAESCELLWLPRGIHGFGNNTSHNLRGLKFQAITNTVPSFVICWLHALYPDEYHYIRILVSVALLFYHTAHQHPPVHTRLHLTSGLLDCKRSAGLLIILDRPSQPFCPTSFVHPPK